MSSLLFWGFFSLLLGLALKYTNFCNANYLFAIGGILIIFCNIYYNNSYQKEHWIDIDKVNSPEGKLIYIINFIKIIDKRNNSRKNKILLNSFITKIELNCINPHCKIKQYLNRLRKGIDSSVLLYDYCDEVFKEAISKNKNDITTLLYYIVFIMVKLNKRQKAQMILKKLDEKQLLFFQDLFNIYRTRKFLEDFLLNPHNNDNKVSSMCTNMIQYKIYLKEFKSMLYKISSLYLDFWNLLIDSHNYKTGNIDNLNNLGKEIKDLTQLIDEYFNKIYNFKYEIKIIKLYIIFIRKVLVNRALYEKYNKIMMNISLEFKKLNREEDFSNYDISSFKDSDQNQWMIISADDKDSGKILNISLSICPIIGYKKNEIIGNNIDILIPNIFVKSHNYMLKKLLFQTKNKFYETLSKNINYIPEQISQFVYCKNKLKYLVPFPFKTFFVQTEEGEHVFIMNIIKQKCFPHTKNSKGEEPLCCVLTDKHLVIQTFTPNAFNILGLNSNDIDSELNIANCISQFGNDIFNKVNNNVNTVESNEYYNYSSDANYESSKGYFNSNTIRTENIFKRELTKKDYSIPQVITWKFIHDSNRFISKTNSFKFISRNSSEKYEIRTIPPNEKKLLLRVKEAKINNELIGYKFLFKKIDKDKKAHLLSKNNFNNSKINYQIEDDILESGISDLSFINEHQNNLPFPSKIKKKERQRERESLKRYDSSLSLSNLDKPIIYTRRRHSLGNVQLKMSLNNYSSIFKVDMNLVPRNKSNFIFDLSTMSYIYNQRFNRHNRGNNSNNSTKDVLLEELIKESKEKISFFHQYEKSKKLKSLSKNNENTSSLNNSSSYSSSESQSLDSNSSSLSPMSIGQKEQDNEKEYKQKNSLMIQKELNVNEGHEKNHNYENKNTSNSLLMKNNTIKEPHLLDHLTNHIKEKNRKSMEYKYYETNLKNIRFMKYDFYKEMIVEVFHFDKMSKMVRLMNDIKDDINTVIHKDEDYSFFNINQIINKEKNKKNNYINKKKNHFEKKIEIEKKDTSDYYLEKEKKIYEVLTKKDKQHSITRFWIVSIFSLCVLLSICLLDIHLYLSTVREDQENINLISESTDLKFFFHSAVYCIREITLINIKPIEGISNAEYEGYPSKNKTYFKEILSARILGIYSIIHNLNEIIISSELPVSKNTSYYLYEKEFFLETITSDFEIISFRTSLSNAFISLDGYLYNLAELTTPIVQNNEDIFPFIHNILNNVGTLLDIQIELYMNELEMRGKSNIVFLYVSYSYIIISFIFILIILSLSYSSFLKTKAKYFYVFYGIKMETIYSLVNKCEFFLQKFKKMQNELSEENGEKEDEDDEESIYASPKIKIAQSLITDNNNIVSQNRRKSGVVNYVTLNQKISKENGIIFKFSPKSFIIYISLFLIFYLIYLLIIMNYYSSFLYLITDYALYIIKSNKYHCDIIGLFNAYREFLFDQNSTINGKISNDYINDKINEIYSAKFDENVIFNKTRDKIPNFLEKYKELNEDNPCEKLRDNLYFNSIEECKQHMHGITTYGLSIIHSSMTEEIRIYKNIINMLINRGQIIGNLTLYESIFWNYEDIVNEMNNSTDLELYYRIFLFNNNSYHKDLNILFINLIYPFFNDERELNSESIKNAIKKREESYIIFFISLFGLISFLFLVYWLPMIKNMNITIDKTKNMLSIIPIHILASQENINGLLNLETDANYKPKNNNIDSNI